MKSTTTYRNGEYIIVTRGDRITAATHEFFAAGPDFRVGARITPEQLARYGYRPTRVASPRDYWGRLTGGRRG